MRVSAGEQRCYGDMWYHRLGQYMSDSRPVSSSHRAHQLADNQVNNELNVFFRCCLLVCVCVCVCICNKSAGNLYRWKTRVNSIKKL